MTFALAALLIALVLAALFQLRRHAAVLSGDLEPSSGRQRALVLALLVLNTVPFAPIWPGSSGGDGFVADWLGIFVWLSLPFWVIALAVWGACRRLPAPKRCAIAELPALLLQVGIWSLGFPQLAVLFVPLRLFDGLLLYGLTRSAPSTRPAGCATTA